MNSLLAGYDDDGQGPSLYYIDYLAGMQKMDFACQGYAGHFLLSIFDKNYRKGMELEEALQLLRLCMQQLKERFVINTSDFKVKIVDAKGVRPVVL